jgi:intracellular septation protein
MSMIDGSNKPNEPTEADGQGAETSPVKLAIDLGPLLVFFTAYATLGIYWATAALMGATLISMIASWRWLGRIAPMLMITAAVVWVFGGLTFALHDPRFIKIKPTVVNLAFAAALGFGLATGRPFMKQLLGEAFRLTDTGWRKFTFRWMGFFLFLAALNEIVWRNFSEPTWVSFKVFGIMALSAIFAMSQVVLLKSYQLNDTTTPER